MEPERVTKARNFLQALLRKKRSPGEHQLVEAESHCDSCQGTGYEAELTALLCKLKRKMRRPSMICPVCSGEVFISTVPSVTAQAWRKHHETQYHLRAAAVSKVMKLCAEPLRASDNIPRLDDLLFDSSTGTVHNFISHVDTIGNYSVPISAEGEESVESEHEFYFDSHDSYSDKETSLDDYLLPIRRARDEQELTFEESESMRFGDEDEIYYDLAPDSSVEENESDEMENESGVAENESGVAEIESSVMDVEVGPLNSVNARQTVTKCSNGPCSTKTRILYEFWVETRGRPFSKERMGKLLQLLSTNGDDELPATMHLFEKCGVSACSHLEPLELNLTSNQSLFALDISAVLTKILASPALTSTWIYGDEYNDASLARHVMMSPSVKIFKTECVLKRKSSHLLIISLWFDEYRMSLAKADKLTAVMMRVDNLRVSEQFLLSLLPGYIDVYDYLDANVIPFFCKLENGEFSAFFHPTNAEQRFFGGINCVLGDHISQVELSGIGSPTATMIYIDRFLKLKKSDIASCSPDSDEAYQAISRDSVLTLNLVRKALAEEKVGAVGAAKETLKSCGLVRVSRFWKLEIFRWDFFARFGICRLHLLLLGILSKTILWLGLVKGWVWCQSLNAHVLSRKKDAQYAGLFLPSIVFFLKASKNDKEFSKLRMISPNGNEIFAIAKIFCECPLWNSLSLLEKKLVISMLSVVMIVYDAGKYYAEDLYELDGYLHSCVLRFREQFRETFTSAVVAEPQYLTRNWKGFNTGFPNFSALLSLSRQFAFFGDLSYSDGSRLEASNRQRRMAANSTNGRSMCRDVLKIEFSKKEVRYFQHFASPLDRDNYRDATNGLRAVERVVKKGFVGSCKFGKSYQSDPLVRELDELFPHLNFITSRIRFADYRHLRVNGLKIPSNGYFYEGNGDDFWDIGVMRLVKVIEASAQDFDKVFIVMCVPVSVHRRQNGHARIGMESDPTYRLANPSRIFQRLTTYLSDGDLFVNTHIETVVRFLSKSFHP